MAAGLMVCAVYTLVCVQMTILAVTLYLHRAQAHRACAFHPWLEHGFRFWLWLTTSMRTDQWVAVHRYHHARVESADDPHSPWVKGIWTVLFKGAFLYHEAAKNTELIQRYAHGTPKDWIEMQLYRPYQRVGIRLLLVVNTLLFGWMGIAVWAVQMLWIPLHAAGIINGLGHYFGYRNFQTQDRSTNIIPWAFWIGGEELHNNHHAFPDSAKFSVKWYEFDLGYAILRGLSALGLATIKRVYPSLEGLSKKRFSCDLERWKALVQHRLWVLEKYQRTVFIPMLSKYQDILLQHGNSSSAQYLKMCRESTYVLSEKNRSNINSALQISRPLCSVRTLYERLEEICYKTQRGQKQMLLALENWCEEAKKTREATLIEFAYWLETTFI